MLKDSLGFNLTEAVSILRSLIEDSVVPDNGFDVPFLLIDTACEKASEVFGISSEAARTIIEGFTIRPDAMKSEGRTIIKPNQIHRAWRRGFFEFPHPDGLHITFSRQMAREALLTLINQTHFQKFPPEWTESKPVREAIARVDNESSDTFEQAVATALASLDIVGVASLDTYRLKDGSRHEVPEEVGEIDFVGYSANDNCLVLLEAKMVSPGANVKRFRADIQSFVTDDDSHEAQLRRKVEWAKTVPDELLEHLAVAGHHGLPESVSKVAGVLVTYFPSYAQFYTEEYPCTSLTNLILDYEAYGRWPYKEGVHEV
jgi:hypothetical protein